MIFDADVAAVGDDVGRAMSAATSALRAAIKDAMVELGRFAVTTLESEALGPTGGDLEFSRMYARNRRLGVDPLATSDALYVAGTGAWRLAEQGAVAHQAKAWGRGSFDHPGTRGSQGDRAWTRGAERVFAQAGATMPERVADAVEAAVAKGSGPSNIEAGRAFNDALFASVDARVGRG